MFEILGLVGGILAVGACIPYGRDMFLKKVKPHRTSFLIWTILDTIAFFSQLAKGATNSLWLPGLEAIGLFFTFFLSLKFGMGGFSKRDLITLCFAVFSLIVWYLTQDAAYALYIVIAVDISALYLTIHKVYLHPNTETSLPWILAAVGSLLAVFSVGSVNFILLIYPIYFVIANMSVVLIREARL